MRERSESAARAVIEDFNERVRASWRQSFAGLPVQAQLADVDRLLEHWRTERAAPETAAEATPQPAPEQPRPPGFVRRALLRLARKPPWST